MYNSMFRSLAIAASLLILASASAWAKQISLIVGGKAIFLHTTPVADGDEVYVPLAALRAIGASAKDDGGVRNNEQKLEIKPASGDKFSCKARIVDGNPMVPIRDIAEDLGAVTHWDKAKSTLSIRARLQEVKFDGTKLKIKTSFPVTCEIVESTWTRAEKKLILDVPGLQIPSSGDDKIDNNTNIPIRMGMRDDNETLRFVLDLPFSVKARREGAARTRDITISVSPSLKDAPAPERVAEPLEGINTPDVKPLPTVGNLIEVRGVDYRDRGSKHIEITIDVGGPAKYETSMSRDPDRFCIELANARLAADPIEKDVKHSLVTGMRISEGGGRVRVVLDLTRLAAFDVLQEKSGRITVTLEPPKGASGSIAGKTIVIDPGHGGSDSGARGVGCLEKDLNLAISLKVEKLLKDAGAIVLMTRKTDTAVELKQRPAFANRHSADLFISIHHNAIGGTNKNITGTETFYHANDASSRALAYCLQLEVLAETGMFNRKVKSDYQRYPGSGFAVLRGTRIPAALLEVAFIDNAADAACARDSGFQQKVAQGIVRGIKAYIEGNPNPPPAKRPMIKIEGIQEEQPRQEDLAEKPAVQAESPVDHPATAGEQAGSGAQSKPSGSLIPKGRVK